MPVVWQTDITDLQARGYRIADNKTAEISAWDREALDDEVRQIAQQYGDFDVKDLGLSDWEIQHIIQAAEGWGVEKSGHPLDTLSRRENLTNLAYAEDSTIAQDSTIPMSHLTDTFVVPPMSVLDTRQAYWAQRDRLWRDKIGDNGESRDNVLGLNNLPGFNSFNGVSVLNPTLAEVVCRWFSPSSKAPICVCDPFAGDTVFGYVAAKLGLNFTGIELRPEQVGLNQRRTPANARYICDDGQNILQHIPEESQDLLFSCPPYFNLEKYSDLPNDASNQDYEGFIRIYTNALTNALKCLKNDRFAVIVMSNVRDSNGFYYDICSETTRIMEHGHARLYNELVLINSVGSASIRARRCMHNRKCCRCHQEVLVYYKGDPRHISSVFPELTEDECTRLEED